MSGKVSSEVTKVTLAELRRLFVMESKLLEYMERKDRKKTVKCGERLKEKSSNTERNAHHGWYEDESDKRVNGLEPMWV